MTPPGRRFAFLRRRREEIDADIDDELRAHLDLRIEALVASGWLREAARREALRRFGDIDATRRYCRRQHEGKERSVQRHLDAIDLIHDVRVAMRGLARAPLLAITIIASVGLGIGAATAIFAIVDA